MILHPMIPSDLPSGLLPLLARRRLSLETPKSIALAGSQPSVSRRRPEVLICIKASALGFDAVAGIAPAGRQIRAILRVPGKMIGDGIHEHKERLLAALALHHAQGLMPCPANQFNRKRNI